MVNSNEIEFLINLCQNPEKATPLDFEKLAELLDQHPDFDLLRKAFILVGEQFGASGQNFEKEKAIWNTKKAFYEPAPIKPKSVNRERLDTYSIEEKINLFIQNYQAVYSPS
ncbi:hypothetical protein [Arcticibacterium luteifluviistationis]|uniref:Uncharacterized protein n=1 Tax=Arcticibacterium luteifluviistationis TaxID=1784714 RepID=A0A2Z4GCD6_9BACT|nr:hypothetical protein [Arcticibacterium luteifluviistationis]AWV98695.1 hypothetical protein DJ013_11130 [Arcticibacterium luteifluviistationis]